MKKAALLVSLPLLAFVPQEPAPAPAEGQSITLPEGTKISIRTIDAIDSKTADVNKEYAASLDDPIALNGVEVAAVNAPAFLKVSDVKNPWLSRASFVLSVVSVIVNGQRISINTDSVGSQSGSRAKWAATGAVAGAAAGAAWGAYYGAFGAKVGSVVGGTLGVVAGAATGGGLKIPSEIRFTFKLAQPVAINYQPRAAPQATSEDVALPPIPPPPPPVDAEPPPPAPSSGAVPNPPSETVPAPARSASEPEFIGVVYLQDGSKLMSLERTRGTQRTERIGLVLTWTPWEIEGIRSPVRVMSGKKMRFVVRLANGVDPTTVTLFPMEPKKKRRSVKLDPNNRANLSTIPLNVTKVGESTYALTPVRELSSGEYCFRPRDWDNVYCFGVETGPSAAPAAPPDSGAKLDPVRPPPPDGPAANAVKSADATVTPPTPANVTSPNSTIKVFSAVLTRACIPGNPWGLVPAREREFLTTDRIANFQVQLTGLHKGEKGRVEWRNPFGAVAATADLDAHDWQQGTYCRSLPVAGQPASFTPGEWQVRVYWGEVVLVALPFRISVPTASPLELKSSTLLPTATAQVPYSYRFTLAGGVPPYRWSGGDSTSGLTLSADGVLSGTPSSQGSLRLPIRVEDAAGNSLARTVGIGVTRRTELRASKVVLTNSPQADACNNSEGKGDFRTTESPIWVVFAWEGFKVNQNGWTLWQNPGGDVVWSRDYRGTKDGVECVQMSLPLDKIDPMPGSWRVRFFWEGLEVFGVPFTLAKP